MNLEDRKDFDEDMDSSVDDTIEEIVEESQEDCDTGAKRIWRKEEGPLKEGEELDVAPGCYDMLHTISLDWSCLSFDILNDDLGACRIQFPHECYVVSGTQPGNTHGMESLIHVMKWSNITRNFAEEEDEDEEEDKKCKLSLNSIYHPGIVNRIKACPQSSRLVCTMSDTGKVHIWDIEQQLNNIDDGSFPKSKQKPLYTNVIHDIEGYAVAWSPNKTGMLATGDCNGGIALWNPVEGGWSVDRFFKDSSSVEDIHWTPGSDVFAAACCDGSVKLFDIRIGSDPQCSISVSDLDVNSVSWNPVQTTCILTGDETGSGKIFDVRYPQAHLSQLNWHKEAITCVGWHPQDSCVCALSSRDDSISLWDTSVESQQVGTEEGDTNLNDVPQQLLFLHMGQTEITELMFHNNIPGVVISTAVDGFNIFKCINID
ncbi:hypothetical protein BEWA_024860 [Theileria equi strain WA]|uniref:Histone-binding protein RBBP4-like N-terminal domain-containing protein n=1 Tax=Theileria equi strain WA TaxID=1537102 RepID=L0AVJ8_THEEQ|nr:hypothetical protein BEWA_024860 [Theileria equi strain WA]AFZ79637.1 hypothetical protein BEWA_024860 [Theileria equi strain WA]|eukprot:XP_004829303.1 hypothetical protein BEWA_024860 [Theileria equi strain WA]